MYVPFSLSLSLLLILFFINKIIVDSHTVELKCMSLPLSLSLLLILFFINKIIAELSLVKECSQSNAINGK